MPVLVDTNVLIDVATDDPRWSDWSLSTTLESLAADDELFVNAVVYAEVSSGSRTWIGCWTRSPRPWSRSRLRRCFSPVKRF
jgi:predicted nucleic acid-binding protein